MNKRRFGATLLGTRSRRMTAVAAGLPLLVAGLTFASAGTAQAACPMPASQNLSPGTGKVVSTSALRVGPAAGCGVVTSVGTAADVFYHCWVQNSAGNKWTHVRVRKTDGSDHYGWIYNGNLNDGGSVHPDNRCRV